MENFWLSILYYFIAYIIVTTIGMLHTIFNIKVLHMKSMKESPGMGEAYEKTKPWHPLYNVVIFPIFASFYFRSLDGPVSMNTALLTGAVWLGITVIIDLIGWVVIKHPWSMSPRDFYIKYQPWISLIYLAIFLSPLIAYALIK